MKTYILKELDKNGVFYFSKLSDYEKQLELLTERLIIFGYDLELGINNRTSIVQNGLDEVTTKVEIIESLNKELKIINSKRVDRKIIDSILSKYENQNPSSDKFIKILRTKSKTYSVPDLKAKLDKEILNIIPLFEAMQELLSFIVIENEVKDNYSENTYYTRKKFIKEIIDKELSTYKYHQSDNDIMIYDDKKIKIDEVDCLADFIKILTSLKIVNDEMFFFRGHSDYSFSLIPSIYRENWIYSENRIFHELLIQHPEEFVNQKNTFEMLTKMQHYELATRLLDVTTNPLVAMFFACFDERKATGEVLIFKVKKSEVKYFDSDTVSVLSNICKVDTSIDISKIKKEFGDDINEFNSSLDIERLVHEIKSEKSHFKAIVKPEDLNRTLFVKSKFDNDRIRRQRGAFILFGIGKNKYECAPLKNVYKKSGKEYRLLINEKAKNRICKELKLLDIHYSSLFPEIINASAMIKEEFK